MTPKEAGPQRSLLERRHRCPLTPTPRKPPLRSNFPFNNIFSYFRKTGVFFSIRKFGLKSTGQYSGVFRFSFPFPYKL